jgi:hypothetical protein
MIMKQKFTVTNNHLRLLRNMNVSWNGYEFGAPSIDPKRPYGNGDVYTDIAELIGATIDRETEDFTDIQRACMKALHKQTETVLQIVLATGRFLAGEYQADKYDRNWEKI